MINRFSGGSEYDLPRGAAARATGGVPVLLRGVSSYMPSMLIADLMRAGFQVLQAHLPASTTVLFRPDLKLVVVNGAVRGAALVLALQQVRRAVAALAEGQEPESSS